MAILKKKTKKKQKKKNSMILNDRNSCNYGNFEKKSEAKESQLLQLWQFCKWYYWLLMCTIVAILAILIKKSKGILMDEIAGRLQIGTLWTQGLKFSSVFEGVCSLELVEVLDRPNFCFRIFSLKIFRGPRTHGCYFSNFHVFVKYFAVLGLCCACGGPLINWNSMDTGTQT